MPTRCTNLRIWTKVIFGELRSTKPGPRAADRIPYVLRATPPKRKGLKVTVNNSGKSDGVELPEEVYRRFLRCLGEVKADEVADEVRSGERTIAEADEWSRSLLDSFERSQKRPDIGPGDWRAFEDGWRPGGW